METPEPVPRQYVRMVLTETIIAELLIIEAQGREVTIKPHPVILLDISPGGLRFKTMLHLKPEASWRVSLRFALEGYQLELRGPVRWARQEDNWWEYGVQMESNSMMKLLITRALNIRLTRFSPAIRMIHERYGGASFLSARIQR